MAEIFVLVLFALLLVWMVGIDEHRRIQQSASELTDRIVILEAQRELLLASPATANRFDDLFRELQLARQELQDSRRKAEALEEASRTMQQLGVQLGTPTATPTELASLIAERLTIAQTLIDASLEAGLHASNDPNAKEAAARTLAGLLRIRQAIEEGGLGVTDVAELVGQLREDLRDTEGRLRNAERRLQEFGRGTEWPACWADRSTGRPEFIFDVALKSAAILVRDNALPHRREAQAKLPIATMRFGSDITIAQFRAMTAPLFKWSEEERCRFFVRVFDVTQPHEKAIYKLHLRTVGEHFYYYEELKLSWDAQAILNP